MPLNSKTQFQTLICSVDHAVATVRLNRPDVRNAFNEISIAELTAAFSEFAADPAVRVIVLAAEGKAFCAGADLNWMQKMAGYTHAQNQTDALQLATMLHTIYASPKPVVAKIQGDCYAGGLGLIAAADIAIAVSSAQFCLSEVKLGLIPATISPYVIAAMGAHAARRYFLTAEKFSAAQAERLGLIHQAVSADALDTSVDSITQALLQASPHAVSAAKRLVRDVAQQPIGQELIADTAQWIADIRTSAEGREGILAFLEKRAPAWLK